MTNSLFVVRGLLGLVIVFTVACSGSGGTDTADMETELSDLEFSDSESTGIENNPVESTEPPAPASALPDDDLTPLEDGPVEDNQDFADLSNDILIPPEAPTLEISASESQLNFEWEASSDDAVVSIIQNDRLSRETTVIASNFEPGVTTYTLDVSPLFFQWQSTEFILEVCESDDCLRSFSIPVDSLTNDTVARLEDSTPVAFDFFGASLSSAADGRVILIGSPGADATLDDSAVTDSFSTPDSGEVSLLFEVDNLWWPGAELQSNTAFDNAQFGFAIAADVNADNIVIGAPGDSHKEELAGSAFTFIRAGETWVQNSELLPGITRAFAQFGHAVAMSDDMQIIAVASPGDPNSSNDPFANDESLTDAGSVSIYRYDPFIDEWLFSDYLQADVKESGTRFGETLSMSDDGALLAVAAPGSMDGESQTNSGAVYLFELANSGGRQLQKISAESTIGSANTLSGQIAAGQIEFGANLSLSADASTLVIASVDRRIPPEQPGLDGDKPQTEVQIFRRDQAQEFQKSTSVIPSGDLGYQSELALSLAGNGELLATGVRNPSGEDNSVTIYQRVATDSETSAASNEQWVIVNSFEAPMSDAINFASSLTFSVSGERLFVGADGAGIVFVY